MITITPVRFLSQAGNLTVSPKKQVVQMLQKNQVPHIKAIQGFSAHTIVVWVEPDQYDTVIQKMNSLGHAFDPPGPLETLNEFKLKGTMTLVAITPEKSPAPYFDYGIPDEKQAELYQP